MRELWLKTLQTGGARAYSAAVGFAFLTITARWLGPHGRGVVAGTITWTTMLVMVGYLSLGQSAMYLAGQRRGEPWLGPVLAAMMAFLAFATAVIWGVVAAVYALTDGGAFAGVSVGTMLVGFGIVPFLLWEQYGSALLMARDRIHIYNWAQVSGKTLALIVLVVFLLAGFGVDGALAALLAGQATVAAVGVRFLLRDAGDTLVWKPGALRRLLVTGAKLHPAMIGAFLLFGADALLVYLYAGPTDTAYYQLAAQIVILIWLVPQVSTMALYTRIARQRPVELWEDQRRFLVTITAAVIGCVALAVAVAPWVIPAIFGERFDEAVGLFQVLSIALVGMTVSTLMGPQWIARGKFAVTAAIGLGYGLLNLGLCLLLVPRSGAEGAAVATAVTYTLMLIPQIALALRCEREYRSTGGDGASLVTASGLARAD